MITSGLAREIWSGCDKLVKKITDLLRIKIEVEIKRQGDARKVVAEIPTQD